MKEELLLEISLKSNVIAKGMTTVTARNFLGY